MGQGYETRKSPPGPGIATVLPPSLLRKRSKLERSAKNWLAANRTEQNRAEVRIGDCDRSSQVVHCTGSLVGIVELKNSGYCDRNRP